MSTEDQSWVFDSLICFLNGPVWNAPLQSFIEEKSLIFELSDKDDEEYRKIHDEFKNLVDLMLGSYMEDIGITPEQFEIACSNGMQRKLPARFQENLFEQIWAANDFEMFKRMMTQKNIELQLQALEMIEMKYGILPQLFVPRSRDEKKDVEKESNVDSDDDENQDVMAPPPPSPSTSTKQKEVPPSEEQVFVEVIKQCEKEEMPLDLDPVALSKNKSILQEEKQHLEQVNVSEGNNKPEMYTKPAANSTKKVDEVELKKRQEYLKIQRDKLVALKKQVRKNHLEIEIGNSAERAKRPKSAKVAEAVLSNNKESEVGIQPETLKFRKALIQRLKSEVMGKAGENL